MRELIKKWVSLPSTLRNLLAPDSHERKAFGYFKNIRRPTLPSGDVVLVQCAEDLYFYSLFGLVISSLRAQYPIRVEQLVLNSLRPDESARSILFFLRLRIANGLLTRKWVGLYKAFSDGIAYRSTSLRFPFGDLMDAIRAFACWRALSNKEALISLAIEKVPVGDLINDSYLRFKPAPTVNLKDTYLWLVIWQAHRDVRRAKSYFGHVRPKLYLTSYSTYIQHGIAVRTALQFGVRVFCISYYLQFCKELTLRDWSHARNPDSYAADFSLLENQDRKLAEAEAALAARLSGAVDSATAYMKQSAYAESSELVPDVQGAIVIFLHDFFDSPHVYRDMVFPDFWEWICFTIETLERANIRFFIKPHPNQINLSSSVLIDLKKRHPNLSMISPGITNKQLAQAGMGCAVTVYGTVAHEMAYLGIRTIACGHNPHVSFGFCNTTKSKAEYAEALRQYARVEIDKPAMRRESLIFYFMHNLSASQEERNLLRAVFQLFQLCDDPEPDKDKLTELLTRIAKHSGYGSCILRLAGTLNQEYGIAYPHSRIPPQKAPTDRDVKVGCQRGLRS